MLPEPSRRWPALERLQQQLAREGLTMGVMERVRLEHVLREAGVPADEEDFVAYVDEDPPRLRRLVSATLAKSAAERELVAGGYARWTAGLPRGMSRVMAPMGAASPSMGMTSAVASEPRSKGGLRWIGALMMMGAMALGGVWVAARWPVENVGSRSAEGATGGEVDSDDDPRPETSPQDSKGLQGADISESAPQPSFGRGEPVDLTGVDVAVPWPVMVAVPRAWVTPPPSPWQSWVVGAISLMVFGLTWWRTRRRSLLPPPAVRAPRPGAGRVQPQLDRGDVPAFVERSEQETLIWGIGREVSDRPTDRLDAERTVEATIARGGLPELWFQPALEHRGVWLWRDRRMKSGQADAKRLQAEIVQTLTAAALPVHVATFARVPDQLQKVDGPAFSPHELDEQRRTARVIVLTDGQGLLRARTARAQVGVADLLQRLAGWHALAVVVFGEHGDEVERMLAPYGIPCLSPADAVAHLAGALHGGAQVERERELLRWETACAMAPLRIREIDALALRTVLELNIEGFAVDALRQRFGRGQHLVWSAAQRAATLADYDRAFGYRAMGWDAVGERALVGRALAFWKEYYVEALGDETLDLQTREHLEIEQLVLGLWDRPEEVVRGRDGRDGLFALFQTEELEGAVRGLVSQYTDVDGSAKRVRLPWRYDERPVDVQVMLGRMGFAVEDVASEVERAGRWGWGLGLALGVGVAAMSHGVMETMMPSGAAGGEPRVQWFETQPEPHWGEHCVRSPSEGEPDWWCPVASRFSRGALRVDAGQVALTQWFGFSRPCEEEEVSSDGARSYRLRCTSEGRLVDRPTERPLYSEAILLRERDGADAYRLARVLLDTQSVDGVLLTTNEPADPFVSSLIRSESESDFQSFVLISEPDQNVGPHGLLSNELVVPRDDWGRLADLLDLAPRRVTPARDVWPEVQPFVTADDIVLVGRGLSLFPCPKGTSFGRGEPDCSYLENAARVRAQESGVSFDELAEFEARIERCKATRIPRCVPYLGDRSPDASASAIEQDEDSSSSDQPTRAGDLRGSAGQEPVKDRRGRESLGQPSR